MLRYFFVLFCLVSCRQTVSYSPRQISLTELKTFEVDGSVRAMVLLEGNIGFAGSNSLFGFINVGNQTLTVSTLHNKGIDADFRSVGATESNFMMLSAGSPALLFKTGNKAMELVFQDEHPSIFYDSMQFWDSLHGIAVGDAIDGCMSILLTSDGGQSWTKQPCKKSPLFADNEALFAASNTNIDITNHRIRVITGGSKSRIWTSDDGGNSWTDVALPLAQGSSSQGAFSIAFYDENQGIVAGGDYTNPTSRNGTIATTSDGGKTWQTVIPTQSVGYVSCIRYVPDSQGNELLATSPEGIWFSNDKGSSWQMISNESYHSLLFVNERIVAASGHNKITLYSLPK